jgi:hypothetical protein
VPDKVVDREAVGEVLATPGTEVAEGVVAGPDDAPSAVETAPEEGAS